GEHHRGLRRRHWRHHRRARARRDRDIRSRLRLRALQGRVRVPGTVRLPAGAPAGHFRRAHLGEGINASVRSGKTLRSVTGRLRLALALYVAAALAALAAVLIIPLSAYSLNLLMQASTYTIAVLGLTIVLGYTGQINLAQAAFFGLGAYSVALG